MRLPQHLAFTIVALVASCALSRQAAAQVTATVPALATVHARTSLVVSSELLRFDVVEPGGRASVTVDFSAAARTAAGADVVLSVEPLTGLLGPGGAADFETTLAFDGSGEGTRGGVLDAAAPTVAAHWTGSGLRRGRLTFTLRAGAPGAYQIPVRFILSAP